MKACAVDFHAVSNTTAFRIFKILYNASLDKKILESDVQLLLMFIYNFFIFYSNMKSLMETFVGSLLAIVLFAYCADLALGAGSASLQ
jgi:hypothetical protein